ncbi:hypothetical protein C5Z26_00790 [Lactobacillus sp. CBA3606]|uniref:hypothetical protein n=1 Tax=Lactobacillus sp. CBA3606 TaxID=2099789 RepID=UPI000CFC6C1A|nr:hypothetical protein [Lactobacillus sp. CBA3606]AVK62763.1 hypothetical protein C5Z26_00790 [Lactobacillus sp. CBA3606]
MSRLTEKDLTPSYDLKRILLGNDENGNYDENEPIKNILMAKDKKYYLDTPDKKGVSSDYCGGNRGDVENYKVVDGAFKELTDNKATTHKDILHSFWMTYKILMQIEKPELFRPLGSLEDGKALKKPLKDELPALDKGYPPFYSVKYLTMDEKYITYFKNYFSTYLPDSLPDKYTWIDFLLYNNDVFDKEVYCKYPDLKEFAKLTHSIANIIVVPKGFNESRGGYDYGDFALNRLKDFLASFDAWNKYVETFQLQSFLDKDYMPTSLWDGHLATDESLFVQNPAEIRCFLQTTVNSIQARAAALSELTIFKH